MKNDVCQYFFSFFASRESILQLLLPLLFILAAEKSGKLFLHGWQEIRFSFSRLLCYSPCFSWIHDKKYSHSKQREVPNSEYFQSVYILLLSPKECCCCPTLCLIVKCFYCWCCLWRREIEMEVLNVYLATHNFLLNLWYVFRQKKRYLALVRDR